MMFHNIVWLDDGRFELHTRECLESADVSAWVRDNLPPGEFSVECDQGPHTRWYVTYK